MRAKLRLDDVTSTLGNNGIVINVSDNQGHVGDLRIGRATVVWMRGKTTEKNGKKIKLENLLKYLDTL